MSRNRFKHTHSLQWATVLKCMVIVGTLTFLGMSYVLMKNQILRLASDVRDLESEEKTLEKRNRLAQYTIDRLTSQASLQQKISELGLGMVKIAELNVVPMETGIGGNRLQAVSPYAPVAYNIPPPYNPPPSTEKRQ